MTIYLPELQTDSLWFPSPDAALREPDGLLAFGGDLTVQRLQIAYQSGIFPWYSPAEPILWWSPAARAVFIPEDFQPAKSLKKFYRKSAYQVSLNMATEDVIKQCADTRSSEETWIGTDMQQAYIELAKKKLCHSVEVWYEGNLVGGLYGIEVGKVFCGESMFSTKTNASKIALWAFCQHFVRHDGKLIDCQILNPHTASLGAFELDRAEYLQHLASLKNQPIKEDCYRAQWLTIQ